MTRIYWSAAGRQRVQDRYRSLLGSWPVPYQTQQFATCQGETFVLTCGPAQAPPLVLFHGGLSNCLMWLRSIRSWSEHFRIYCVDTIGDPGFSAPSRPSFATEEHALWLDDVWRELSLVCPDVVGWSLGGWLGLDYAMRRPASVRSLVLLSPGGVVPMRSSMFFKVIPLLMMGSWGGRKAFHVSMGSRDEGPQGADSAFVDFSLLAQRHMLGRTRLPTVFTDAMLRSLPIPLTVFIGERDIFFDAGKMRNRLAVCLPDATVHCLAGVGHGLLDPTRLVLDALDSQRSDGRDQYFHIALPGRSNGAGF